MTTTPACLSSLHFQLSRLRAGLSVLASLLAILLVLPGAAWAQMPGQYGAAIDPPGRVARLNLVEGAVSFAPADAAGFPEANAWTPALLNRPLTSGDRLWTGPRARSELHIGSTAVRMSEQTSLDFLTLDDNTVQLRLAQGTIRLRVRTLFEGQRLEVNTPNLAFVMTQPGDYRLDANPISNITRVVVLSGAGVIYGDSGETVNLGNQQQANFTGTQLTPAGPGAAVQDSFDAWAAERDRREDQSVSARYIPRETLGYQQLDSYGDWRQDATYGAVWLPRAVPVHWAPYRVGHWSWIAPWGWTWIDDAPWGFAPFHYGRWAQIGPRWAWVPGRLAPRPVYAPALVAFIGGNSGGVHWSVFIGSGGTPRPSVGWFPLAPDEPFRPTYRVSPRYVTEVNHNIVVNNTVNVTNIYRYQRQPAAVTAVSRDDFSRGRPVRGDLTPLSPADLSRAQVVTGGLAEGAANRGALPQRPDFRERPRPAAAAALPPAAVVVRPVVGSREERREDRRDDRRDARRDERPQDRGGDPRAQMPVPAAPAAPVVPPRSPLLASPDAGRSPLATPQDRPAIDAENRARREQQQLQRDQERQQGALTRQQDAQRRQAEESLGQRALREQAQKNGNLPPPTSTRPADQDARAAAERSAAEQAQRAQQQQLQRDQQRQQAELARQQDQQRRQNEELAGQRAMREQAQRQQAQQQQEQARQMQEQQRQQQALQQQRAQQEQQRNNEELLGQRALREQAQRQQAQQQQEQRQLEQARQMQEQQQRAQQRQNEELAGQRALREQAQQQQAQQRQQQALQQQQQRAQQEQQRKNEELLGQQRALREQAQRQQEQHRAQQEQQRQAHEQSQRQQQEQRKQQQAEEKQQARQADAARAREPRPEGGPNRHKEQ